jgi:hypothetical protein
MPAMHLDEEQVWRVLHGELAAAVELSIREHLAGCADCRERLETARREEHDVYALLRQVDHPVPSANPTVMVAGVRGRGAGRRRLAAGIVLAVGFAGVAYAAPGSPVPMWVAEMLERLSAPRHPAQVERPSPPSSSATAGIAVAPGRALVIVFTSRQPVGEAVVSLTDSSQLTVHAPIAAATFTSEPDRLVIHNQGSSANFDIAVPTSAPRVEIRVGEEPRFLKEGPRITTRPPMTGTNSRYVVPLTDSKP